MSLTETNYPTSDSKSNGLNVLKGTTSNKKLLDFANNSFNRAKDYRQQFETQWYMNLCFFFGRHYMQWSSKVGPTAKLFEPAAPPWRVRLVANKFRQYLRKEQAKITKENPMGFVIPLSSDDEDILAAQAGDALSEFFWREIEVMKHVRRAIFWTSLTGTGFLKDGYSEQIRFDEQTNGNVYLERISPFHMYVLDVQEEEMENQPLVIHACSKNTDFVNKSYGVDIKGDSSSSDLLENKFLQSMGIKQSNNKDQVFVKEMWLKPCKMYPEGAVITWAQDKVLKVIDKWPYAHGQFPFSKIELMESGRFFSDSSATDLIPLQKEYNRTRSQLVEAKNRMSKPQLIAPRGSVNPDKITSEPGLIIFYTPGFQPPQPLPLQSIPQYVLEELNRTDSDMMDISSQHAISKGGAPPGVHAATAISYLQEQDDSILSHVIASEEAAVQKVTRHFLSYVTQFWNSARQIQITGENASFEVLELDKNSLRSNTNYFVQPGSATPKSQAAKQAFIMELFKMGLIPGNKALRYLEMSETGKLYEELQVDARQAQRENAKMALGIPTTVNTWDEHMAHIPEHDNYRKRQQFEMLDTQTQQLFEQHVRNHKAFILVHKGIPQPMIDQALADPSGLELDRLLYMPPPGMMPGNAPPGASGPSASQPEPSGQPSGGM
jgi:hypothetical protein